MTTPQKMHCRSSNVSVHQHLYCRATVQRGGALLSKDIPFYTEGERLLSRLWQASTKADER